MRPDWLEPLDCELGFTGSREEPSSEQRKWVLETLITFVQHKAITGVHHGCCKGSDAFFHRAAKTVLDLGLRQITLHPPLKREWEMEVTEWDLANCIWYPRKNYLARDRDIVANSGSLLATPLSMKPTRGSGTWYTIHHAKDSGKNGWVCFTDGTVIPLEEAP